MDMHKIKTGVLQRELKFDRSALDAEKRTVSLAFSSETPVERWFGTEILDHKQESIRLGRLQDGGALLVDHDPKDHVGVVESVSVGPDKTARAVVRFGQSARAQEVWQDVLDGIRTKVSVGYVIHAADVTEERDQKTYRATDWEPLEISIVSIPADAAVGIGRDSNAASHETAIHSQDTKMDTNTNTPAQPTAPAIDTGAIERDVRAKEMDRISNLEKLGQAYAQFDGVQIARACIQNGSPVAEFQRLVLEQVDKRAKSQPNVEVGLTQKEVGQFSFIRAINALANPQDRKAQDAAAFEFEAGRAAAEKYGKNARGIMLPYEVMARDMTTGTGSGSGKGGNMVATDVLAGSFIDVLRNRLVVQAAGATFLTGLLGNVAIPKKTAAATAYWVAENSAPTEGNITLTQVTMSPKTLAAYSDFSRRLTLQSSVDVEAMIRNDLAASLAVGIDAAAIASGGTNKPTGILGTSGVGDYSGLGTNGGAPTWAMVNALVKEVDVDNALNGALKFVTNAKVAAKLRETPKQASGVEGSFILGESGVLMGYPLLVSNQVPSDLAKGTSGSVLSAMIFGNWSELLVGMWSGVDLMVDPYTGSNAGTVRVVAFADVDVAVRHAESFAVCNEIIAA